jgi:alcohol dehydrogenase class IV
MTITANWAWPTPIRFGAGRIAELAEACHTAGIRKPLVVTDRGLARLPLTLQVMDILRRSGFDADLFAEVDPNPNERNLGVGVVTFKQGRHDGVIALGGGSGLDLGKLVAFMAGQSRPVWDFEDIGDWWTRADAEAIAPVVAVPTTAGTGSEVGRAAVLTNSETHEKKIIFHPKMMPAQVICDPELTVGMPPVITAGTGVDALAHCIEAYCSPLYGPMADGVALEGMRLCKEYLLRAYRDGSDLEARAQMMTAAAAGATAFQKGLGAIHSLSHPIGARYDTHHGTTNGVVMLPVLRFNRPAIEDRIVRAAAYLGLEPSFDAFLTFIDDLLHELDIPKTLDALGVSDPDLDALCASALKDPTAGSNPVPLTRENILPLLQSCFET